MLKITAMETATEKKLIVQGSLVGPWVTELRTAWKRARHKQDLRPCIIDINDVTFIDAAGQTALVEMIADGAQLTAKGAYSTYVIEQAMNKVREKTVAQRKKNRGGKRRNSS